MSIFDFLGVVIWGFSASVSAEIRADYYRKPPGNGADRAFANFMLGVFFLATGYCACRILKGAFL